MMLLETLGRSAIKPLTPQQICLSVRSIRQDTAVSRQLTYDFGEPIEITSAGHRTSGGRTSSNKIAHTIRARLKETVVDVLNKLNQEILTGPLPILLIALHSLKMHGSTMFAI